MTYVKLKHNISGQHESLFGASTHTLKIWTCEHYTPTKQMIVHDIIVSFCILSLLKYDTIFGKKLEHNAMG